MSGIFAVLFSRESSSWTTQLDSVINGAKQRGNDGTKTVVFNDNGFELPRDRKFYRRQSENGNTITDNLGFIGCAYSGPISLSLPDPGPFFNESVAAAYDGVVSGYTGNDVIKWFDAHWSDSDWSELTRQLDGQFAMIAFNRNQPERIYYATKAKPLYMLYDSLGRGIIVASSRDSLRGHYHSSRNAQPVELEPYSAGHISLDGIITKGRSLYRYTGEGTLVLSGGGLDTLVAAFAEKQRHTNERIHLVNFDYGAKAGWREQQATKQIATELNNVYSDATFSCLKFPLLNQLAASTLTDSKRSVSHDPQAGKASEWVPARNTVLLSLALSMAETGGYARIALGINQDAATAYPDNDSEWLDKLQAVVPYALGSHRHVKLDAPLRQMSKVEIVKYGEKLNIPWASAASWSCYEGGPMHCGTCSSCRARRKAFKLAKVSDPTEYFA
jgi:7-cyano-7-deazaguanine synthase